MAKIMQFDRTEHILACVTVRVFYDSDRGAHVGSASWPTGANDRCTVQLLLKEGKFSASEFTLHTELPKNSLIKAAAEERGVTPRVLKQLEEFFRETIRSGETCHIRQ